MPAAAAGWLVLRRGRARQAVAFTNVDVLATVTGRRSARLLVAPSLFVVALAAASVAVARPYVTDQLGGVTPVVVLVVDTSGSMRATDVKPTRLGAVQSAVRAFLARVPAGVRVGLVALNAAPEIVMPPTADHAAVGRAVDGLVPGGGTSVGDTLAAAVALGRRALGGRAARGAGRGREPADLGRLVSIVLLSDGAQTSGRLEPLAGAELARRRGIRVYTMALGTSSGTVTVGEPPNVAAIPVPPDPPTMAAIARSTGGRFADVTDAAILRAAYTRLTQTIATRRAVRVPVAFAFLGAASTLLTVAMAVSARTLRLP